MEIVNTDVRPLLAGSPTIGITPDEEPITPPGGSDAPLLPEDLMDISMVEL